MKAKTFNITEFENPSGGIVYRVTGTLPDGTRIRKNFRTETEAIGEKQVCELMALNQDAPERMKRTALDTGQLEEAELAFSNLKGKSLTHAVKYYLDNYSEPVIDCSLAYALEQFIKAKIQAGRRERSIGNYKQRIGQFCNFAEKGIEGLG